ncbi:MAG: hypothetical protein M1817_005497 [Caeruleum heppii]|nr:MAG: hypothetical protein M1817_005497 [Caeruleum heppii]
MASADQSMAPPGMASPQQSKPYAPINASLGGVPTLKLDVPITAVFLVLFILGAITHMTIFQTNKRRGHKFILSGVMFGFCMARIVSCIMRIAWATHPTHIPLAIAAMIFISAGVVLLFIVNLIFAQRIIRATHPSLGWHKLTGVGFRSWYAIIIMTLVMVIICTVQPYYTLNLHTRRIDRNVQLYGGTLFAVTAFLPILLVLLALVTCRQPPVDDFGKEAFAIKIGVLLTGATVLTLGAAFRTGTNYLTPRPRNSPAWYHSKACFYVFNLGLEIVVIYLYAALRVDQRFHVPNGSHGPGQYSASHTKMPGHELDMIGGDGKSDVAPEDEVDLDEARNDTRGAERDEGSVRV